MKRLLCLNQFTPPDKAPTSLLLGELKRGLEQRGWQVDFLGGNQAYRSGKPRGWRRWWREIQCHVHFLWQAAWRKRATVVLCLTDPPGLPFTAALIAKWHRAQLVHWAMDVYPEIAEALGEVTREGRAYRLTHTAVHWAYRQCAMVVCLDEDMARLLNLIQDPRLMICPPWPPAELTFPEVCPAPAAGRLRWLYSGNLGRAHEFETLLQAQLLLEKAQAPFDLVFQGGGTMLAEAQARAQELGLKHCVWEGYAPAGEFVSSLLASHFLVATQRNETLGMLWPSKLALLQQLPRRIVWVGPPDGAIARSIQQSGGHHGVFSPGQQEAIAQWLEAQKDTWQASSAVCPTGELISRMTALREHSLDQWHDRLSKLV